MYLVGIDIGKLKHSFCLLEKETGEILVEPVFFENSKDGFNALLSSFKHLKRYSHWYGRYQAMELCFCSSKYHC